MGKSALIVNDSEDLLCKLCYASCIMLGSGEKHEDISFGDTWSYSCASSRPEGDEEFDVREVEHGTIVVADEEDEVYHISEFIDANSGNGGKHPMQGPDQAFLPQGFSASAHHVKAYVLEYA